MALFGKKKDQQPALSEEDQAMVDDVIQEIDNLYDHKLALPHSEVLAILNKHKPDDESNESEVEAAQQATIDDLLDADDTYVAPEEGDEGVVTDADKAADKAATKTRTAQKAEPKAIELADKIKGNDRLVKELHEYVETESKRKIAPASLGLLFYRGFDKDFLMSIPKPGTRYDDKDEDGNFLFDNKGRLSNMQPDIRKPGKEGGGSFCQDVANTLDEGRTYVAELDMLSAALDDKQQRPDKYRGKTKEWLKAEQRTTKDKLTALKNAVKTGLSCAIRMYEVRDKTKLYARFRTEGEKEKETIIRSHMCIQVYYRKKDGDDTVIVDRWLAPSTFLRVDLDAVAAHDDPDDQLDAFIARKGTGGEEKGGETVIKVTNANDFADAVYELAGRRDDKAIASAVAKKINGPDGGELLDCMYTLEEWLHSYTRRAENKEKVAEYRKQREDEDKSNKKQAA